MSPEPSLRRGIGRSVAARRPGRRGTAHRRDAAHPRPRGHRAPDRRRAADRRGPLRPSRRAGRRAASSPAARPPTSRGCWPTCAPASSPSHPPRPSTGSSAPRTYAPHRDRHRAGRAPASRCPLSPPLPAHLHALGQRPRRGRRPRPHIAGRPGPRRPPVLRRPAHRRPASPPTSFGLPPAERAILAALRQAMPLAALGHQVVGHRLEDLDVRVDRRVVVGDRERPLLLAAGRHEDAAVHVVEPGELGEVLVLVGLEGLVVDDLRRRERDAALGADADRVARQVVLADDGLAAGEDALVERGRGARRPRASGPRAGSRGVAAMPSGFPL